MEVNPEIVYLHPFPAFGHWDTSRDMPIAQYLQSTRDYETRIYGSRNQLHFHHQPSRLPLWDVFECTPLPPQAFYQKGNETAKRVRGVGGGKELKKPARICDVALEPPSPPPADSKKIKSSRVIDEDLYKISPELLQRNRLEALPSVLKDGLFPMLLLLKPVFYSWEIYAVCTHISVAGVYAYGSS